MVLDAAVQASAIAAAAAAPISQFGGCLYNTCYTKHLYTQALTYTRKLIYNNKLHFQM